MNLRALVPSAVLVIAVLALGGADYFLVERPAQTQAQPADIGGEIPAGSSSSSISSVIVDVPMSSSSVVGVTKGVGKQSGPAVKEVLMTLGFTWTTFTDASLIESVIQDPSLQKITVLKANDRTAGLVWIDSPDVKDIFIALKDAIQQNFSGNVSDLVDETRRPAEGAPQDILAFRDPGISPEHIVFARIRTRLYEFHVADGQEQDVEAILQALAR